VFHGRILPVLLTPSPDCALMAGVHPRSPGAGPCTASPTASSGNLLTLLKHSTAASAPGTPLPGLAL